MLAALDSAIATGSKLRMERHSGAINLFGETEYTDSVEEIPDIRERPKTEILAWEKETLGFYLSGHPLDEFREKFSTLTKSAEILGGKFSNKRVKVGGLITDVRQLTTKRGDMMAYLKLEDFDGVIDVMLFPNVFYQTRNVAQIDNIVVIEGRADNSSDPIQIIAEKVTPAKDYAADFWITIPARLDNPATLDDLKKIFNEHAGAGRVFLNRNGVWKKIAKQISDSSDLREKLKNLLGIENVRLY